MYNTLRETQPEVHAFSGEALGRTKLSSGRTKPLITKIPALARSPRLKALLDHLYNEGCIIISSGTCVFSTPMTEAEIDTLVGAFKSGFAKLASLG
jgi:glutamate-1-semialdehyde aminotransferase